jgi:hypothetical protein
MCRSQGLVGHECYVARGVHRSCVGGGPALLYGSVLGMVKCGRLFMASKYGVRRGSTRVVLFQHTLPPLSGSATPDLRLGAAGFDRGRVLLGWTYLPILTD